MLRQRILTALSIASLMLLAIFFLSPLSAKLFFAFIVLLGAWEWSLFIGCKQWWSRSLYVLMLAVCMLGVWSIGAYKVQFRALLWMTAAWWLLALLWIVFCATYYARWLVAMVGVWVLVPAWVALSYLHTASAQGAQWVLFLLLLIALTDVGAYFAGRALGRHKLAPRVSPGKTWEGVAGGLAAALVVAWCGAQWFTVNSIMFVPLCLFIGLVSIVGDLSESLFKRAVGLKDSGQLLPGHGGVLDRIDSVTAAAPCFLLGLLQLGVLQ